MIEPNKIIELKSPNRPKVLVAEDEPDIAALIEDWLSDQYDVTVALNGKTAVQKAVWHQPQVVLLDVVMHDMGGYDVLRLLQGAPQTKTIPVIVMTAKNFDDSTIKMIKAEPNVFGFLNKPFKPSELIKMLEIVLKGGRVHTPEAMSSTTGGPAEPAKLESSMMEVQISSGVEVAKTIAPSSVPAEVGLSSPQGGESGDGRKFPPRKIQKQKPVKLEGGESFAGRHPFMARAMKLLMALVFLGVAMVAVGEWASRQAERATGFSFFVPPIYPASRFNSFFPYQWHNPNNSSVARWDDGRVVYQFNQWGLRGIDFPLVTPPGVRRILVLGGTSVFGVGVEEKDTIPARLETLLNEKGEGTFQVVNAGLWAFSPKEQWAYVKGQGFNYKPEVILWLCESRPPGAPSSEGIRWLVDHRWLASNPWVKSRFIQMLVQLKIRGEGDPLLKEEDPLFQEAEKMAKDQKVALTRWVLPRGGAFSSFQDMLVDRLFRSIEK